ncbi:Rossmann-like domain-containing protein [Salinifilum ghardaiensis]
MLSTASAPAGRNGTSPDLLAQRALGGQFARDRDDLPQSFSASVAFLTVQGSQHSGRRSSYVNTVLSIRVHDAVGSCAVEPGELGEREVQEIVGCRVDALLSHPEPAVRVAALDAYLTCVRPHISDPRRRTVRLPPGGSLEKSTARARAVAELVHVPAGGRVAVIGVVNSLLSALRERGVDYVACDLRGGRTEWDEPVLQCHRQAIGRARAVLASGMVLGNDTFNEIAGLCRDRGLALTMFAQTGSAVARELLGSGVDALSAEPYPFFWLTGDATEIHLYSAAGGGRP